MTDNDYLLIFITFSLVLGIFNSLATLVEVLIQPFGYNSQDSSLIGAILIAFGIVGATVFALIIERNKKYKFYITLSTIFGVFILVGNIIVLYLEMSFTYICILMSLLGFFMVPVMPLSFELACELSFPVGEAIAAGMLVTGG